MSKWRDTGQMTGWQILDIPPVWLLAALGLVWAQARFAPVLTGSFAIARVLAVALALGGVALAVWAVMAFRAHRTSVVPHQIPEALITTGPFRFSRNPIYLADVMVLLGAVLWFGAWPAMVVVAAFIFLVSSRFILPEEARLRTHFPVEYAQYARLTRRWL